MLYFLVQQFDIVRNQTWVFDYIRPLRLVNVDLHVHDQFHNFIPLHFIDFASHFCLDFLQHKLIHCRAANGNSSLPRFNYIEPGLVHLELFLHCLHNIAYILLLCEFMRLLLFESLQS